MFNTSACNFFLSLSKKQFLGENQNNLVIKLQRKETETQEICFGGKEVSGIVMPLLISIVIVGRNLDPC